MRLKLSRSTLRTWLAAKIALLTGVLAVAPLAAAPSAQASYGNSIHMGWDSCGATVGTAQAFWNNTPYYNMGLYIGGSNATCPASNSDVSQYRSMGYQFMPLWVGLQAPCPPPGQYYGTQFSYDPGTAYNQGKNEAVSAYQRIYGLGWDTLNAPISYDLEGFNTGDGGCVSAAQSFINGWVYQLHLTPAQLAGVYGSVCSSALSAYASIGNVPDYIYGANYDGNSSTSVMSCIPSDYWVYRQRHKQYNGGHTETWNGVMMQIDSDCSNGPVYPGPDALTSPQGCE